MLTEQENNIVLPDSTWRMIYGYLTPADALAASSLTKRTREAIKNNIFWEMKYERHFPRRYQGLIKKGNVDWYDQFRETYKWVYKNFTSRHRRLFSLVKEGDVAGLRGMVVRFEDVRVADMDGCSLLFCIQRSPYQSVRDYFYELACHEYTREGQHSVDVTMTDRQGITIFYWALAFDQPFATIRSLLTRGSSLDENYFPARLKPIHVAAERGRLDLVRAFINDRPDVLEQMDLYQQTALLHATINGHAAVVVYLLSLGADINVSIRRPGHPDHGKTPLHLAIDYQHESIVRSLMNIGADVTRNHGISPLQPVHKAAMNGHLDTMKALIESNHSLLEQEDGCGQTPLLWAAMKGHEELVAYFISLRANLNAATHDPGLYCNGRTPLYWAVVGGHVSTALLLMNAGASVTTALGAEQLQLIHAAVRHSSVAMVQALVECRPDFLELVDGLGRTPLWLAVMSIVPEKVECLIHLGANLNVSINGKTLTEFAEERPQWLIRLIADANAPAPAVAYRS